MNHRVGGHAGGFVEKKFKTEVGVEDDGAALQGAEHVTAVRQAQAAVNFLGAKERVDRGRFRRERLAVEGEEPVESALPTSQGPLVRGKKSEGARGTSRGFFASGKKAPIARRGGARTNRRGERRGRRSPRRKESTVLFSRIGQTSNLPSCQRRTARLLWK